MGNKQTAVEWLVDKLMRESTGYISLDALGSYNQQALEMEKEQMEEFYNEGQDFSTYVTDEIYGGVEYWEREPLDFEQYYKEKYGKV